MESSHPRRNKNLNQESCFQRAEPGLYQTAMPESEVAALQQNAARSTHGLGLGVREQAIRGPWARAEDAEYKE